MNCSDISRLLDERAIADLSAAELSAVEAHLSGCADCAAQCLASERVSTFRSDVPPMPASLREQARRLGDASGSATGERRMRRPVIIGSLLLLGAAATMFATVPWQDPGTANR